METAEARDAKTQTSKAGGGCERLRGRGGEWGATKTQRISDTGIKGEMWHQKPRAGW